MKPILRPFYIFALNTNDAKEPHILLDKGLNTKQFKTLQGSYKGQVETSYLVDADFQGIVWDLAREYNQESILYVDENRNAYLEYLADGRIEKLGKFQAITNVKNLDAYTVDLSTGIAYAAL